MINNKIQFPLDWTKKDYKSDGLLKGTTRLLIEGLGSGPWGVCVCVCVWCRVSEDGQLHAKTLSLCEVIFT